MIQRGCKPAGIRIDKMSNPRFSELGEVRRNRQPSRILDYEQLEICHGLSKDTGDRRLKVSKVGIENGQDDRDSGHRHTAMRTSGWPSNGRARGRCRSNDSRAMPASFRA